MNTSAEVSVGREKAFDRIYKEGLAGKPIVIDRVETEIHQQPRAPPMAEEAAVPERKETEVEKEAWRLLRKSVVSYGGSPVGTLAADDPMTSGQMLNYDQVFIRDFVPSALAFFAQGGDGDCQEFSALYAAAAELGKDCGLLQPWARIDACQF